MANGKKSRKNLVTRRRAFAAAFAVLATGATASCSNTPEFPGRTIGATAGRITEEKLTEQYGSTITSITQDEMFYDQESFTTNPGNLGIVGPETRDEYPEENFRPTNGRMLMQVVFVEGQLRIKDHSRDGIDPNDLAWFAKRIDDRREVIETAMAAGQISKINFRLDGSGFNFTDNTSYSRDAYFLHGEYDASGEKELDFVFPHGDLQLDRSTFVQQIMHETGHALLQKVSDEIKGGAPVTPEVQRLINACDAVHAKAMEQMNQYAYDVYIQLDLAQYAEDDPMKKAALKKMRDEYLSGDISSMQPASESHWIGGEDAQLGELGQNCATNSVIRQFGLTSKRYFPGTDRSAGMSNPRAEDYFYSADAAFYKTIGSLTVYGSLTEENVNSVNPFGHPYDNIGEAFASAFALTIVTPENVGRRLSWTKVEDAQLAQELIDSVKAVLLSEYPQFAKLIDACYGDLQSAKQDPHLQPFPKSDCTISY